MLTRLSFLFISLVMALPLLSSNLLAADISGTWQGEVKTDAGNGNPSFVLKQEGEKITGTYSGQLGEAKLTGTIKGDEVTFSFDAQVTVVYVAKVDPSGKKMSGTVDLGGQASGTFTAEKK